MEKGALPSLSGIQREFVQCVDPWGANLIHWLQKNFNEENVSSNNELLLVLVMIIYYSQGVVSFTLKELKGVPEDVVSGYAKRTEDGKELYDVTHKTPDIFPVVRNYKSLF
jgi:hypothetical protein